ncbi:MAG: MFS transporter [Pirellulales bacterium]|nr:MFS transporter [Pirellulales bacterium]
MPQSYRWYRELNGYHWFVLMVAALGWMFDCLDQQLFVLARQPAMTELLGGSPSQAVIDERGGYATSIFLMGWAIGGLFFGVLGDRVGRARTMVLTILLYSVFTGLSALSTSFWDFCVYRFLTGLGVGGEFAVGIALVAEVMPDRARPYCLSLLQALSVVGNITAAFLAMGFGTLAQRGVIQSSWRPMFAVGALPALVALLIRARLREPERWQAASRGAGELRKLGSYGELFGHPVWRRHAFVGLGLAFAGVVGLWAVAFYTPDLVGNTVKLQALAEGVAPEQLKGIVPKWKGIASIALNLGAALGMVGFAFLTQRMGRRPAFAVCFVAALASSAAVFSYLREMHQLFWLLPIMGSCIFSLFAGYAIYLPELFPTHLRSTGTSFCYNVGRFVAALGPALLGWLTGNVFRDTAEPLRNAGLTMCVVFALGLFVLPFAPETKGRPLPE